MKVTGILFSVLLVLFLNPAESGLAHNGVDEATEAEKVRIFQRLDEEQ